ncbi:hypothetical protein HY212_06095 [Candidatus Pacearchaeota archaeon]|nr:hypothetical protein [Candidatus Pacearchaeota archaeon]
MKKTKEALKWIIKILRKHKVPFLISGGFDAKVYGSKRLLADIDIEIHDKEMYKVFPYVKEYIIYGPKIFKNKEFNLFLMTLKYKGQEIDICGKDHLKMFDKVHKKWFKESNNFKQVSRKKIYGIKLPLEELKDLISYKKKIRRRVDIIDVKNLSHRNI